jgi:hypothetical protein
VERQIESGRWPNDQRLQFVRRAELDALDFNWPSWIIGAIAQEWLRLAGAKKHGCDLKARRQLDRGQGEGGAQLHSH